MINVAETYLKEIDSGFCVNEDGIGSMAKISIGERNPWSTRNGVVYAMERSGIKGALAKLFDKCPDLSGGIIGSQHA